MALMLGKLYSALRAGDVPEPIAREAAEEVAGLDHDVNDVKSTLRLHTWILTFHTALLLAIAAKLFWVH